MEDIIKKLEQLTRYDVSWYERYEQIDYNESSDGYVVLWEDIQEIIKELKSKQL
jgi:hypothetical protein